MWSGPRRWPVAVRPAHPGPTELTRCMKNQMALTIPLAVVLSAAVATVALLAAARRQGAQSVPSAEPAPVTVTVGESRPRSAVTTGTQDGAGHEMARPPSPPGRPASVREAKQPARHER